MTLKELKFRNEVDFGLDKRECKALIDIIEELAILLEAECFELDKIITDNLEPLT